MGRRRRKTLPELGEHPIFGDEAAAQFQTELAQLRSQMDDLTARINAQFTSIAAHAEIAHQDVQLARDEARADMERSRDTLTGLIDQLRHDLLGTPARPVAELPDPGQPPRDLPIDGSAIDERFDAIENVVEDLAATLDRSLERQRRLADTMSAFIDTMLAQQTADPIADLAIA